VESSRYVNGAYAGSNPDWHDDDAGWKASRIASFVRDSGAAPSTLCDIGCGTGGVLSHLAKQLPEVVAVGYDVSPQAVEMAARLHPGVDVRLGDAVESGKVYDLAMLIDVFEHVEDYMGFLRRVSVVGRQFLFHIPLDMNVVDVWREHRLKAKRDDVGHLHYFSKLTALETLRDTGYRIDATRYTTVGVDAVARHYKQRLLQQAMRVGYRVAPDSAARILGGGSLLVLATPARADSPS